MNNKEFIKLKNSLAIKCITKIILYSIITILILELFIDGIYNDTLARDVAGFDENIYYWCVANKDILIRVSYSMILIIISFFVIRKSNDNMIEIISAMDKIMKNAEQEVKLSNDLIILENRLNSIRVDLVKNKHKAEEELQKKNDLIMYMAHDLKTPLTSVIGYLTLLTEEKEINNVMREKFLKIALDKSIRLEELTNQFFEITRYNLQEMPINKKKIDLSVLIGQLTDEFFPMTQEKHLKFIINTDEHVYFHGDGDKLARAFGNLIKNAINYSYDNTNIEINVSKKQDKICISFKNKGEKIPEYKLDKIFDKFYRVDESRASNTGGTGLGLAITKEIIELHDGKINVKNNDEYIEFDIEFNSII